MAAKRKGGGSSLFEPFGGKGGKRGKGGKGGKGRVLTILNAKLNGGRAPRRARSGLSRVLFGEGGGDENAPLKRAIKKQLKVTGDRDLPNRIALSTTVRPTTPPPHRPTTPPPHQSITI